MIRRHGRRDKEDGTAVLQQKQRSLQRESIQRNMDLRFGNVAHKAQINVGLNVNGPSKACIQEGVKLWAGSAFLPIAREDKTYRIDNGHNSPERNGFHLRFQGVLFQSTLTTQVFGLNHHLQRICKPILRD